ncbi:MAG TPA: thiamine pyrophosphate-dependent enzyme [Armatimonadota bacterium]|nr:thiamine pyrophosphate-dependent enzyme [Armatimonadota bacterium]
MAESVKVAYAAPECMIDQTMHYCPGCTHGIAARLVAETIDELGIRDRAIGISPVGCSVYLYDYIDCDFAQAAHGRAPAVATGLSRALPDCVVFTYQGDGDLASIGTAEIVHAASRNERMTVVFINNAVFGMTQGQSAPTTLLGQRTSTSPRGRQAKGEGYPLRVSEMLATLEGPTYVARAALGAPKYVTQAKRFMRRAFEAQVIHGGFGMLELLSSCPTYWGMTPAEAMRWLEEGMMAYYPVGEFVDRRDRETSGSVREGGEGLRVSDR